MINKSEMMHNIRITRENIEYIMGLIETQIDTEISEMMNEIREDMHRIEKAKEMCKDSIRTHIEELIIEYLEIE
jgi:hypothetical protein